METYTIPRTGQEPLTFEGEEIARSLGSLTSYNRHHNLYVYRTTFGNYVLQVRYVTLWQDEYGHDYAVILDEKLDSLRHALKAYDPVEYVPRLSPCQLATQRHSAMQSGLRLAYGMQRISLLEEISRADAHQE